MGPGVAGDNGLPLLGKSLWENWSGGRRWALVFGESGRGPGAWVCLQRDPLGEPGKNQLCPFGGREIGRGPGLEGTELRTPTLGNPTRFP